MATAFPNLQDGGPGENPKNFLETVCLGKKLGMGMKCGPTRDGGGPQGRVA